jgi:hypothetical protein
MIDKGHDTQKLHETGFGDDLIESVQRRIRTTEFKRRMPLIARLPNQ